MKFEKCNFEEATHILLADGVTVREIAIDRKLDEAFAIKMVNGWMYKWQAETLGATFVRLVDGTPKPWDATYDEWPEGDTLCVPNRFVGHCIRVHIEVIK